MATVEDPRGGGPPAPGRLNDEARRVLLTAGEAAAANGMGEIEEIHLLFGLAAHGGAAARALSAVGIDVDSLEPLLPHGEQEISSIDEVGLSDAADRALDYALDQAQHFRYELVTPEVLVLGIAQAQRDSGEELLEQLGTDAESLHSEMLRVLFPPVTEKRATRQRPPPPPPPPLTPRRLEAAPTHTDRPATRDRLDRQQLAEVLAERIRRVRNEDTESPVRTRRDLRAKLQRDARAARSSGSFLLHIHAPWGAGKSSLLNFLGEELRNRSNGLPRDLRLSQWIVVEFSAWEHQRLAPPWWWLLASIRRSAARELRQFALSRWLWFRVRDVAWLVWNSRAAWLTLLLLAALAVIAWVFDWFGLEGSDLTALKTTAASLTAILTLATVIWGYVRGTSRLLAVGSAEGAHKFLKRAYDPLGVYQRRFSWLVRSAGRPIAIFIDDLDRCRPDYVVELLEGVQTLFAREPVVYVVAADRTWVCESYASAYGDFTEAVGDLGRPLGYLFLEKTFQMSIEIRPMSVSNRRTYWARLTALGADEDEQPEGSPDPRAVRAARWIRSHIRAALAWPLRRYRRWRGVRAAASPSYFDDAVTPEDVERRIQELVKRGVDSDTVLGQAVRKLNAPEMQDQLERLLVEFEPLLENNPRAMKRLLNAYGVERDLLIRQNQLPGEDERRRLVLFTILRMRWPYFAEYLVRHPDDVSRYLEGSRAPPKDHPFTALFGDDDVRAVFNGERVKGARLDAATLRLYAGVDLEAAPRP